MSEITSESIEKSTLLFLKNGGVVTLCKPAPVFRCVTASQGDDTIDKYLNAEIDINATNHSE